MVQVAATRRRSRGFSRLLHCCGSDWAWLFSDSYKNDNYIGPRPAKLIVASINRLSRQLQVVAAIQLEINSQTRSKGGKNY